MDRKPSDVWEDLGARQVRRVDNGGRQNADVQRKPFVRPTPTIDPEILYGHHPNDFDRVFAEEKLSRQNKAKMSAEITIYTDGSCKGNPGPGGWAAILIFGAHKKELSGRSDLTTNNRMELIAAISALKALNKPSAVCIMTDSAYVKNGITKWVNAWKEKDWKTANKQEVKNRDLWEELHTLCSAHTVRWCWVKAHDGNSYNERCDELAYKQASGC